MLWLLATSLLFINSSLAAFYEETKPLLDGRIVGGQEVDISDYPYQASIEFLNSHRCGGAIIARTWILSGAQCAEGLPSPNNFRVRVGTTFRGIGGQVLNVRSIVVHNNFSFVTYDFDIVLFQLEGFITLSRTAQIINLPDNDADIDDGTLARVAGWGAIEEGGSASTILRSIEIPIFSHSVCVALYSQFLVSDRMICAGFWDGGKDACMGDGGGPLVINSRVVGIVSWGLGCARPQSPGVYTKVGAFRDWISEVTGI